MANLLAGHTSEQLRALLRKSERPVTPRPARITPQGRMRVLAKCTSTTPAGSGVGAECYPAVIVSTDPAELVADQPTYADVWLTVVQGGAAVAPTSGAWYECELAGTFDPDPTGTSDPRLRVFAVADAGSSLSYSEVLSLGGTAPSSNDTPTDTGIKITLPSAGTYRVSARFFLAAVSTGVSGLIIGRWYDQTAGAAITNSDINVLETIGAGTTTYGLVHMQKQVTVAVSSIIRVELERDTFNGAGWSAVAFSGRSQIDYLKLA